VILVQVEGLKMEQFESGNEETGFLTTFRQLPIRIKQMFIAMIIFTTAVLGFSTFSYLQQNGSLNDQQDYIDLISSEIGSIQTDLAEAQQEIVWLKQTVDAVIDRVDTVCDFLRGYTWC